MSWGANRGALGRPMDTWAAASTRPQAGMGCNSRYFVRSPCRRHLMPQLASLLALCLVVAGCSADVTLQQVHDLADTVTKSLEGFQSLPAAIFDNCVHEAAWLFENPPLAAPAPDKPITKGDFDNSIGTGLSGFSGVATVLADGSRCAEPTLVRDLKAWRAGNAIIIQYIGALNDLAGGKDPKLSTSFTDLAKSVKDAKFVHIGSTNPEIDAGQIVTAGNLLDQAVKAAFAAERAKQVVTFARRADPYVTVMIGALYKAASYYDTFLAGEHRLLEGELITRARLNTANGYKLDPAEAEIWYQTIARMAADRRTLNQYVDLLNTIAKAQAKLLAVTADSRPEQVIHLLQGSAAVLSGGHGYHEFAQ